MSWKHQNIYKLAGKFDYQQQYKAIIEAAKVPTPEGSIGNIPIPYIPYVPVKQPNVSKSLRHFSETSEVKPKNAVCRLCAAK